MKFFETQGSGRRRGDRSKEKAKEREESGGIQQSKQREGESKRKGEIQEERNKETSLGRQQIPPPGRSKRAPRETHTQCSPGPVGGRTVCAFVQRRATDRPPAPPPRRRRRRRRTGQQARSPTVFTAPALNRLFPSLPLPPFLDPPNSTPTATPRPRET